MKHPDQWRDTVDPFTLPCRSFRPLEILGYPHAGNDVFYVKGLHNGTAVNAYIKVARQRGADVSNEIAVLSQLRSAITPAVLDFCLEGTPFLVTQELTGERLSTIAGENRHLGIMSLPRHAPCQKVLLPPAPPHRSRAFLLRSRRARRFFPICTCPPFTLPL